LLDLAGTGSVGVGNKGVVGDGRAISKQQSRAYLTEIRSRLDKAAGNRARSRMLGAGADFTRRARSALDMEQLLVRATTLLNAASLINRIGSTS